MGYYDIAFTPPPRRRVFSYRPIRSKAGQFAITCDGEYYRWGDKDYMYLSRMEAHRKAKELQVDADALFELAKKNFALRERERILALRAKMAARFK